MTCPARLIFQSCRILRAAPRFELARTCVPIDATIRPDCAGVIVGSGGLGNPRLRMMAGPGGLAPVIGDRQPRGVERRTSRLPRRSPCAALPIGMNWGCESHSY